MDTQRLSAFLMIAGFIAWLAAAFVSPPGIYQTQNLTERSQILKENPIRWIVSQLLWAFGILLPGAGFVSLGLFFRGQGLISMPTLGALAFAIGSISGALAVYQQTMDPIGFWDGKYTLTTNLFIWLVLPALILFGLAFLQVGLPLWLGYLVIGVGLVSVAAYLLSPTSGFFIASLVYLLSVVIAIVLLGGDLHIGVALLMKK